MKYLSITLLILIISTGTFAQFAKVEKNKNKTPSVYHNLKINEEGNMVFVSPESGKEASYFEAPNYVTLKDLRNTITGTKTGLKINLNNEKINGIVYFGLFADNNVKFPQPVFFKVTSPLIHGVAEINISQLSGKYDIANWEKKGIAKLGYRIVDENGKIIYDGKIYAYGTGPFEPGLSLVEGPFLNKLSSNEITISFTTNMPSTPYVIVEGKKFYAKQMMGNIKGDINHEIKIDHLLPDTKYNYTVVFGKVEETYSFKTVASEGSRKPFTFAYASDSREGKGGGERNIHGVNAYIMKKMAALAVAEKSSFMQFTGDMINGYGTNINDQELQYANWKRSIEAFWHYIPFNVGPGNHEALLTAFNDGSEYGISVDKFPFNTSSAERIFANSFVNPQNGPESEDGSKYDPNKSEIDFPSYKENVYYYVYDNTAIIVLNSNYLYTPMHTSIPQIGGNVHGYVMDNQIQWLEKTINTLDKNKNIDHIFVTIHTPAFPNGGHAGDDMWYDGNNSIRPFIAGQAVEKGILERRDEFLDIIINKSDKVLALLCGDEHNYSRMKINNNTPMYPENFKGKKLNLKRDFWQITNGSAGAPYYGQQVLPWSRSVEKFSTQYALMLFDIDGEMVKLRVVNPDTFDIIEEIELTTIK
jgi:hypothetical protein